MWRILEQMRVAADEGDATQFVRANWALHARIAETSPNPILRSFYLTLLEQIESHTLSVMPVEGTSLPEGVQERYRLHAELVDAIAERDPRALEVIRVHNTDAPSDGNLPEPGLVARRGASAPSTGSGVLRSAYTRFDFD